MLIPDLSTGPDAAAVAAGSGAASTSGSDGGASVSGSLFAGSAVGAAPPRAEAIMSALDQVDLTIADVDWFVPHQANSRILDGTARKLSIPPEKIIVTVDRHGNTSAASVPLALAEGIKDGRIKKGDLVLFEAMGGGLTWGSALVRM